MASKENKHTRRNIYVVPIEDLAIENGFNKRFDYGDLRMLADSIKENGVLQPIHVFSKVGSDKLFITDGHRRFKAAKMAAKEGWEGGIPVIKYGRGVPSEEERTLAIITHNGGKPLNLLEEGMVYKRLLELGMNSSEIARKVGKSVTHIITCSNLLDINESLIEKIKEGKVTPTMVIEELKTLSEEELNDAIDEALSTKDLKKVTKKHLKKRNLVATEPKEKEPKVSHRKLKIAQELFKESDAYFAIGVIIDFATGDMTEDEFKHNIFSKLTKNEKENNLP